MFGHGTVKNAGAGTGRTHNENRLVNVYAHGNKHSCKWLLKRVLCPMAALLGAFIIPRSTKKTNIEHRTLNVQRRILYSVYLKGTERQALYVPTQRAQIHPWIFLSLRSMSSE